MRNTHGNLIITGRTAINYARNTGKTLRKYADPTEDAVTDLSIEEAEEVAREDASPDGARAVVQEVSGDGCEATVVEWGKMLGAGPWVYRTAQLEQIAEARTPIEHALAGDYNEHIGGWPTICGTVSLHGGTRCTGPRGWTASRMTCTACARILAETP